MSLLLLLSAMLSAIGGAMSGVRANAAPAAVCAQAQACRAQPVRSPAVVLRPVAALPTPFAMRHARATPLVLAAAVPLFASRRRE